MKLKSGVSSVFLDDKIRSRIKEEKVTIRYLVDMGLKAHTGELLDSKTAKIVQKLSETSQKKVEIEEKLNKILKKLRKNGEKITDWLK